MTTIPQLSLLLALLFVHSVYLNTHISCCEAAVMSTNTFPIGTPGKPWGVPEREEWRQTRPIQRSYKTECVDKLLRLGEENDGLEVLQYGALAQDPVRYPLYAVRVGDWASETRPHVLVTGGVHGYETSGVQGAIRFLKEAASEYADRGINVIVVPCVSPWGYETIQRWNHLAVDPNRSFNPDGVVVPGRSFNPEAATDESRNLIDYLKSLGVKQWLCHIDLHETTDTDESEFGPAKAARDGKEKSGPDVIPDGFYLVADSTNPQPEWHTAMIDAVKKVTHIAPPDEDGNIIGEKAVRDGVIEIPSPRSLGLCAGVTNAEYATTTEVYPDSEHATAEQCDRAQVACVRAGLDYILNEKGMGERASD